MKTRVHLLLLWQRLLDIALSLPRESLGLGPGIKNSLPWRTPGILSSSVCEHQVDFMLYRDANALHC